MKLQTRLRYGGLLLLLSLVAHNPIYAAIIPDPVFTPAGAMDWVGSVKFGFEDNRTGKIFYTLDGSQPSNSGNSIEYKTGAQITLTQTTTVTAIRYVSMVNSDPVVAIFRKAKVPTPIAKYGGQVHFHPSLLCTLQVARTLQDAAPTIKYTLDGTNPGVGSATYTSPFQIMQTSTLKAIAVHAGYENSDPVQVDFVLDSPAAPMAEPAGKIFSTNTLSIRLSTATAGSLMRYTLDTTLQNLDTATLVQDDSISIAGTTVNEVITVRAQTFKNGYPASSITTEKYTYLPMVSTPVLSKTPGSFYDSVTLFLTSPTPGAIVRYVTDNSTLTPSSPGDGSKPIRLTSSTTLKAQAYKNPQPNSAVLIAAFTLKLTPPEFDQPSTQFKDSIRLRLTSKSPDALIYYSLNGSAPSLQTGTLLPAGQTVTLTADSTLVKAIAVKDGITSEMASGVYTKKPQVLSMPAPHVEPAGREFSDSLYVTLSSSHPSAQIFYTTNGTDPSRQSLRYQTPIKMDSSTTLKAQAYAVSGSLDSSVIREERYIQTPSMPIVNKPANVPYPNKVEVTLSTKTLNGVIKYMVGNAPLSLEVLSTFTPGGKPILFTSTTRLRAVTVLGTGSEQRTSTILDLTYEVYTDNPSDTLETNGTRTFAGGFGFTNLSEKPVLATTHTTETYGLIGFKDAPLAISISRLQPGQAIKIVFTKPSDPKVSLYRHTQDGVEFVSSENRQEFSLPGEYFIGVDTMAPVIKLLSQNPKPGDSTHIKMSIKDNVKNPFCEIESPGILGIKVPCELDTNGIASASLKAPGKASEIQGLWIRVAAGDYVNTSHFPNDPKEKFYLSQSWTFLQTPPVLSFGNLGAPWDMAGFPVNASTPITWKRLKQDNAAANLQAVIWNQADTGFYSYLQDTDTIKPGMAFFVTGTPGTTSIVISNFLGATSEPDGTYRMTLKPGWNQVTSPLLTTVYWPTGNTQVKRPFQYWPATKDYSQVDSLVPWKGYFVFYYGDDDTVITVYTNPLKRAVAKSAAALSLEASAGLSISLDYGRLMPLNLAAHPLAKQGFGSEDQPDLPAWSKGITAWSARDRKHLMTDVVRYVAGEVHQWNVVVSDSGHTGAGPTGPVNIKVLESALPLGFEAWAVSSSRKLKFRLEAGKELPLSGMSGDTLSVYAGPLAKLAQIPELHRAVSSVNHFYFDLVSNSNGRFLRMALPWRSRVEVTIWSISGRVLAKSHPGRLNPGLYDLPLSEGAHSEVGVLKIRTHGVGGIREFSRRVVW